jgi:KaiC/GvpD/RAD55 family RecA-like ATPase
MNNELLKQQLKVLGHEGYGWTEFRNIAGGKFVGINPRLTKEGTKNEDVSYLTCVVIDIDPIRLPGTPSTEEQHEAAIDLGRRILENCENVVVVDSGSGCHVYFPIEPIPVGNGNRAQVAFSAKHFIDEIRRTYETQSLKIDAIQDLARVIRVWGSHNNKSNRKCFPITTFNGIRTFFELVEMPEHAPPATPVHGLIPNGSRNSTLVSLGGSMRRRGMSEPAIYAALSQENAQKCNPPLPDSEVKSIATSVSRYEAVTVIQPPSGTKSFTSHLDAYETSLTKRTIGYSTGFKKLDEMLSGLQRGKLYVIAARTNEGKTSLAVQIAFNLINESISTLYFPTELGYAPLYDKIIAASSGVGLRKFQTGNFTDEEKGKIQATISSLRNSPFHVHEDFALTLETIKLKVKEINPKVVIIDYIQAFKFKATDTGQQAGEIAEIVRGLKQINEEYNIPIILCSQFSRGAINAEVSLQFLKGSGSIEEFSDVVMALSTLSKYESPRPVELYILKSRYSEVGKIRLDFYSAIGKFIEHEQGQKNERH